MPTDTTYIEKFDYDTLPAEDAGYLRASAAYIQLREKLTHQLIAEMGAKLIETKEYLAKRYPGGVFIAWVEAEFDFSISTAENYCNVARNMPYLPDGVEVPPTALYLLSATKTPDSARQLALEMLQRGEHVDPDTAYILSKAPEAIVQRYITQQVPKAQAVAVTRKLRAVSTPGSVREYAIEQGVEHPAVVDYLTETFMLEQKSRGTAEPHSGFTDIQEDGGVLNGIGWSVPLKDANERDIDRYRKDRAAMHRERAFDDAYDLIHVKARVSKRGTVLKLVEPSTDLALHGGEVLMVDIRVSRKKG